MTERKVKLDRANKSILLRALGDVYYGQRANGGSTEVTGRLILRQVDEFRVKELFHGRFILHIRFGADPVNDRPEFFPCHSRIHQINSGVCACSSRVSASSTASV